MSEVPQLATQAPIVEVPTAENGVTPGRELIPVTPSASETAKPQMTDQQITDALGDPPTLEHLVASNTAASSKKMSLADQNRADFRLQGLSPLARQREEQRIAAEAQSGGVISAKKAKETYAAEAAQQAPITAEVTELPADENANDIVIQREQEITPSVTASPAQTEATPNHQPEAAINLGPADPRILALLARYDETTSMLRAEVADLKAQIAAQNKPATEVTQAPASTEPPGSVTPEATPDQVAPPQPADVKPGDPENKGTPLLTEEQQALVNKINLYVEKLSTMKVRNVVEISKMVPEINKLTTELQQKLDIVNHPERAKQLEAVLSIIGGKSITEVQANKKQPNLNLAIINVLQRFSTPEAQLQFKGDVSEIQNTIQEYITSAEMTPENLEALRAAIGKTDEELNGSALGEIIKLILAAVAYEFYQIAGDAISQKAA